MPITGLWSYTTTGNDFDAHWTDLNANRVANTLLELLLSGGYGHSDLISDIAFLTSANTGVEDLDNAFDQAASDRDNLRLTLRSKLIEFRGVVNYRLPGSGLDQALPRTFAKRSSEERTLKALEDMASVWTRVNAHAATANYTPPLVLRDGYTLATFIADVAALRAYYKTVSDAENDLRIARKERDTLLDPLRSRFVEYREAVRVEYGEEHPFYISLPDVYPSNGGSGGPTFLFHWIVTAEGDIVFWFEMPAEVTGVTNIFLREGIEQYSTGVLLNPGQGQQLTWQGVTINGEIDEVVLRDAANNVLASGVRDPTLPDPGV